MHGTAPHSALHGWCPVSRDETEERLGFAASADAFWLSRVPLLVENRDVVLNRRSIAGWLLADAGALITLAGPSGAYPLNEYRLIDQPRRHESTKP
jgi:hypothetical protein